MPRKALSALRDHIANVRAAASAALEAFSSADGRWTVVSTSLTAGVALVIGWLTISASPAGTGSLYEPRRVQASLPYDLFVRLSGERAVPAITAEAANPDVIVGDEPLAAALNLDDFLPTTQTRTLTVYSGETIMGMLADAGVDSDAAVGVVNALLPVYSPRAIRSGQVFEASFSPPDLDTQAEEEAADNAAANNRLLALTFSPSVDREITVTLEPDGSYSARDRQKQLDVRYQHAGATIDSSLYLAAMQAGIPADVVVEMIRMYSYDVDFQRDVHPGDSFEVFFDRYFTPEGEVAKSGEIAAATMTLAGKAHTLYRFETAEGPEYFDENGQSAKSMLMKTPVDGARLTSGFGRRMHPVLGYTRMHKGIDFGVPTGTPVMAAGSGTVQIAGRLNGFGNYVRIVHANGYATAYGHLSRFAAGIKPGMRVHQGQIIAYSGMTGIATGPHLHYEVLVNNTQVNPLQLKVANGRKLQGAELAQFIANRDKTLQLMASMPVQNRVAADASGLRPTTQ